MKFRTPLSLLWFLVCLGFANLRGEDGKPAPAKPASAGATNAATAEPEIPRSVFIQPTSEKEGRDPFFPNRKAIYVVATVKSSTNTMSFTGDLKVSGISGTRERPLCVINNTVLAPGDETDVPTPSGKIRVLCLAIQDDTVTISVNGVRQELRFRPRYN